MEVGCPFGRFFGAKITIFWTSTDKTLFALLHQQTIYQTLNKAIASLPLCSLPSNGLQVIKQQPEEIFSPANRLS